MIFKLIVEYIKETYDVHILGYNYLPDTDDRRQLSLNDIQ